LSIELAEKEKVKMTNEYGSEEILTMTMGEYKDKIAHAYSRGGKSAMNEAKELYPDIVNTELWECWFPVDDYEEES
jgi:hypothetical protein